MPPEPAILKRKRSQPSHWWTVGSNSNAAEVSPQPDEPLSNKHDHSSAERVIQEAPTAGNRGNISDLVHQGGIENVQDRVEDGDRDVAKPLRRGRSSNTEAELVVATEPAAGAQGAAKKKPGRAAKRAEKEDPTIKKPGQEVRSSNTEADTGLQRSLQTHRGKSAQRWDEVARATAKPFRKGRPSNAKAELADTLEDGAEDPVPKNTHGRSASVDAGEDEAPNEPVEAATKLKKKQTTAAPEADAKKRGRRSKGSGTEAAVECPPAKGMATKMPPGRNRPPQTGAESRATFEMPIKVHNTQMKRGKTAIAEVKFPVVVAETVEPVASKRRTRHPDAGIVEPAISEPATKGEVGRTTRGRRSGKVVQVVAASSSLARNRNAPKKGVQPSVSSSVKPRKGFSAVQEPFMSKNSSWPAVVGSQESSESKSWGKKSKSHTMSDEKRKRKEPEGVNEEPTKRRRVEREPQQEPALQAENLPMYQYLTAVTRRVSRQTIDTKWAPLLPDCIELISQLLQDVKRPVVVPLHDDTKRKEATKFMQVVSRRLISKISKGLPFPPAIRNRREEDFDFEKILDHNRALESLLTPVLHANELLKSEIAKEKAFLESEEEALVELETNAKTETAVRKAAARKLHPLLLSNNTKEEKDGLNDDIGLGKDYSILPFTQTEDEDLQDIAKHLGGHLDTIQGNISRVEGITDAMSTSRAAVQATLFEHLVVDQFEDVILG